MVWYLRWYLFASFWHQTATILLTTTSPILLKHRLFTIVQKLVQIKAIGERDNMATSNINPNLNIFDMAVALIESTPRQSKVLPSGETMTYREYNKGQPHVIAMLPGYICDDTLCSVSCFPLWLFLTSLIFLTSCSMHQLPFRLSPCCPNFKIIILLQWIHEDGMGRVWTHPSTRMRRMPTKSWNC